MAVKIFTPKDQETKERILNNNEVDCKKSDYTLLRELSVEELWALDENAQEFEDGNIVEYENGEQCMFEEPGCMFVSLK